MIKIEAENYDYIINGYVSNLNISKSNRNSMITLVNGRVVRNSELNKVINDAYHKYKFDNRYPVVVLNINVDYSLYDISTNFIL